MASFSFNQIAPYLGAVGNELINLDENIEGADDYAGNLLVYVAEVGVAIQQGQDIPEIPEVIRKGVTGKISPAIKATLRIASSALTVAQFTVTGKAAIVIKYINQVLRALLAGQPVPTTSSSLIQQLKEPLDRDHNLVKLDRLAAKVDELSGKTDRRDKADNRITALEKEISDLSTNLHSRLVALETKSPA